MSRILKDQSGHYLLAAIVSIHPLQIKGEARDQSKVTAVHTAISTVGGQTHHTTIPWEEASKAFEEYHAEGWAPALQPPPQGQQQPPPA